LILIESPSLMSLVQLVVLFEFCNSWNWSKVG